MSNSNSNSNSVGNRQSSSTPTAADRTAYVEALNTRLVDAIVERQRALLDRSFAAPGSPRR
jgi:hypothetical protein